MIEYEAQWQRDALQVSDGGLDWPPSWQLRAACLGVGGGLFFPERGVSEEKIQEAKHICAGCPVRLECLEYGLHDPQGIWGGLTVRERRKLLRQRRMVAQRKDDAA